MESAPDFEQLSKIDDVSIRQRAALEIYRQWKRKDAASAQKWIEATPHIPAEWKSRLSPPE